VRAVRVVVTLPAAVAAYLADRRDWLAEDCLMLGHRPTWRRVAVVTAAHALHRAVEALERVVCGPDFDDDDDGDRRVGFLPGPPRGGARKEPGDVDVVGRPE